jgi:hypothetical protein
VVYRISAPEVVVEMVTDCVEVYVPATGLNVGVATGVKLIVYAAVPTAEVVSPDLIPMAFSVVVTETLTGLE